MAPTDGSLNVVSLCGGVTESPERYVDSHVSGTPQPCLRRPIYMRINIMWLSYSAAAPHRWDLLGEGSGFDHNHKSFC